MTPAGATPTAGGAAQGEFFAVRVVSDDCLDVRESHRLDVLRQFLTGMEAGRSPKIDEAFVKLVSSF
ncbi:hypothetical protein TPA0908_33960 [Micromonospora sp. AKA38]|nr:hypothetical protein TPA0908_33960 [Micromonospora sp. AKA38]